MLQQKPLLLLGSLLLWTSVSLDAAEPDIRVFQQKRHLRWNILM